MCCSFFIVDLSSGCGVKVLVSEGVTCTAHQGGRVAGAVSGLLVYLVTSCELDLVW